jgi:uncharacterized delta-60 repeat protein
VTDSGQIVVAGAGLGSGPVTMEGRYDFTLQRLNSDGSVDTTFGTDGRVATDIAGREDIPARILQQPDGRLVVVGYEQHRFLSRVLQRPHVVVARYEADGTLDATFGTGGIAVTDLPDFGAERAYDAAIQDDRKLVIVGAAERKEGDPEGMLDARRFLAIRYNADGTLDSSFGREGVIVTKQLGALYGVSARADGRLVMAGERVFKGNRVLSALRTKPNGILDRTFGRGGIVDADFAPLLTQAASVRAADLELTPDGKILVAGSANGVILARFTLEGQPDKTFGWDGRAYSQTGTQSDVEAELQPDGKILVASSGIVIERVYGDSVTSFASVSHRTLVIEGTEGGDDIRIADAPSPAFRVFSVTRNGYEQRFAREDVDRVLVRARGGDDTVIVEAQVFPVTVFGGRGSDRITGSAGAERLFGEDGNDTLVGNAGMDLLSGGRGDDVLEAIDGESDRLLGGAGTDRAAREDDLDRSTGIER